MNYRNTPEQNYRQTNCVRNYAEQTFRNMYESAVRFFRQDGHLGDYSKEAFSGSQAHYLDKTPKNTNDPSSNYKLRFNSA